MRFDKVIAGNYYIKLSISIIVFSMAIVIVLSVIFSDIYSKSILEQLTGEYEASASKMNNSFINLNKEIDQLYIEINLDINAYTFLNENMDDEPTKARAFIHLNDMYQINPYVDSIILYNSKTKANINIGKDVFDAEQILKKEDITSEKGVGRRSFLLNEVEDNNRSKKKLISFVYRNLSSERKIPESVVIINLDRDAVQNGIFDKANGSTFICENNGENFIGFDSSNSNELNNFKFYYQAMSKENKELNSIILTEGRERKLVTYVKNNLYGWSIINVNPYNVMVGRIQEKRNTLIIISIIVLFICLLAGYFISRILYMPIRKITNVFKDSKYASGINKSGEIALISEVYSEVLGQVRSLEKKNEDFIPRIKEDFLRKMLRNSNFDDDIERKFADYQVNIQINNLFIALVKIDASEKNSISNDSLYEPTAVLSALKLLENTFRYESVNMLGGEYCILLNFKNQKNNNFETLLTSLKDLKALLNKIAGDTVALSIGGVANTYDDCRDAYSLARDVIKNRFVLGYDKVIYKRYIDENLTNGRNYPNEIEKKLIYSINMNNRENYVQNLQSIVNILENYVYDDAYVIFLQIVLECIRTMNQVIAGYKSLKVDFGEFGLTLGRLQILEQAKKWMIDMFDEYQAILREVDSVKDNKYFEKVEEIKKFIAENYSDINLSIESLAEKSGYTPNYFAKIFKNITGIYLNDYIKQVRITKAKELLKNSNYSINDISNMVGFINSNYFYSAFRKDVGLTPSSYRNYKITDDGMENNE
jgi:AraC-type DNA-binding domain-containing proteins